MYVYEIITFVVLFSHSLSVYTLTYSAVCFIKEIFNSLLVAAVVSRLAIYIHESFHSAGAFVVAL